MSKNYKKIIFIAKITYISISRINCIKQNVYYLVHKNIVVAKQKPVNIHFFCKTYFTKKFMLVLKIFKRKTVDGSRFLHSGDDMSKNRS